MVRPCQTTEDSSHRARCSKCGYILEGLKEPRCPECGTPYDPRIVANRKLQRSLLPWEYAGHRNVLYRICITYANAWFRPKIYFANAKNRSQCSIYQARNLIGWSIVACVACHVLSHLFWQLLFFGRLFIPSGNIQRSFRTFLNFEIMGARTDATMMGIYVSSILIVLWLSAVLLHVSAQEKINQLKRKDLVALLSPYAVFYQCLFVMRIFISELYPDLVLSDPALYSILLDSSIYLGPLYIGLISFIMSRRLLELHIPTALGTASFSIVLTYIVQELVTVLLVMVLLVTCTP